MKKIKNRTYPGAMTRREFVGRALAVGIIGGAPAFLRGQNLNNKLNLAFIACGGRAHARPDELTVVPGHTAATGPRGATEGGAPRAPHPGENVAALCDINHVALASAAPP